MKITRAGGAFVLGLAAWGVVACTQLGDTEQANVSALENTGTLGLSLAPVSGVSVTSLHYTVTRGDPAAASAPSVIAEGNLPTPGSGAALSFGTPLPVGSGYYLSLSGVSAEVGDDVTCSGAYGPFAILANSSTAFSMTLTCVDNTKGQVLTSVDVKTDACPHLIVDYVDAEPARTAVGSSLNVRAAAHDLDNAAEPIKLAWSIVDASRAATGYFTPISAAESSFFCANAADTLKIQVTATNHQCSKSLVTTVSCFNDDRCGNGVVDPGETCDGALDPTCPAGCEELCGDGLIEGSESCDPLPSDPAHCIPAGQPQQCTLRQPVCGDGFVNGTEVCDTAIPLPGPRCAADCTHLVVGFCGDGVKSVDEECDASAEGDAFPGTNLSRTCAEGCTRYSTPECVACEQAGDCFASSDNCAGPGNLTLYTLKQRLQCTNVAECLQQSHCLEGTGTVGRCYCGTLSTSACAAGPFDLTQPGAPNGPCAAVMQLGNPTATSNSAILGSLYAKGRPAGGAGQRLNCDKNNCATACGLL